MGRTSPLFIIVIALVVFFISERFNIADRIGRDQKTTVSFWAFSVPANTMLQLKSRFEQEHPGITVEVQTVPWESLQQKTLWAIAAKSNVPDVIVGSSEWIGGLATAGALEPLDERLEQAEPGFFSRYFPSTVATYQMPEVRREDPTFRGAPRQYGIPLDLDMMLIYYRQDMLEPFLNDLQTSGFPATWEDFRKLADAVKAKAGPADTPRLLYLDPDDPVPMSMAFLPASGGSFLDKSLTHATLDSRECIAAFSFFGSLLREGAALQWTRSTMEDPMVLYKTGRAFVNISGPWYAKLLESKAPELAGRWRVALFPRREPGLPSCGLGGACIAMPFNAPNKEAAITLIRYMAQDDFALAYFASVGSPPPQISAWNKPVFSERQPYFGGQAIYDVVREAIETARPLPLMPDTQITKGPVRRAMRAIAVEGADPAETLRQANLDAAGILAAGTTGLAHR